MSFTQQDSIPVGYVPTTAVASTGEGVYTVSPRYTTAWIPAPFWLPYLHPQGEHGTRDLKGTSYQKYPPPREQPDASENITFPCGR